ncbi:unnamed protein product [Spirodela intermedia]|uniref:RRM domain-containing protein n=1 Tax=Spirodela intermedia TaxID=51605 RepID=A0A7I8JVY7_SPIIN|nr:unnamed protein product [Spirodela intermedia]
MESDLGKLFIGGISWDTDEDLLRDYFRNFGEVVEAVIMKDRTTGRARGFGFVVFADPAVAESVLMEKHTIDGRIVEAKKAVPRDDQQIINRNNGSIQGSPGHGFTKKIFVGGLPSTVTEADFRRYFEKFGTITDAVVMYDHNTQRPRGFGFITYESEDAVDKVLFKTFHELNGKMVEVKKAVPKESSPAPAMRSPMGPNYGQSRVNSFFNGSNSSPINGFGVRMDARFGSTPVGRSGFPPFSRVGYRMGMNFDPGMSPNYSLIRNHNNNVGFGREMSPFYSGSSSRFTSPIGYSGSNGGAESVFSSSANLWGNGDLNYAASFANGSDFLGSKIGELGAFGDSSVDWAGPISTSVQGMQNRSLRPDGGLRYESGQNRLGLGGVGYGRSSGNGAGADIPYNGFNGGYEGAFADVNGGKPIYGDPTWCSASPEIIGAGPFGFGLGDEASDVRAKDFSGYMRSYDVTNGQSNGGKGPTKSALIFPEAQFYFHYNVI